MRLLVVNSNTSNSVTDLVAAQARAVASPGTEVVAVTARFGARSIESRLEGAIAAHATLDALAAHADGVDAGIVACFSDPGLPAAREAMPFPVVGIAEAAMTAAGLLGARFSIVTIGPRLRPVLAELAAFYGFSRRLASIRTLGRSVLSVGADQQGAAAPFLALCRAAVAEDGAEVIILGGAVMAGLAAQLGPALPVPVLDGVACAVAQAEALVRLAPKKPTSGSYARPAPKESVGLGDALARLLAGE